jgi:hypothetical protein
MLHPTLGVDLSFTIGIADSREAADYQTVIALASERMLATTSQPVKHLTPSPFPRGKGSPLSAGIASSLYGSGSPFLVSEGG